MDRLIDHLFVFEGNGVVLDFPGNYTQYRESENDQKKIPDEIIAENKTLTPAPVNSNSKNKKQLSFKEKREFELLEKEIATLNDEKLKINERLNTSETNFEELQKLTIRFAEISTLLDEKETRWLELSEIAI
jgi:ATP-binding cassette subfamily F protein uup